MSQMTPSQLISTLSTGPGSARYLVEFFRSYVTTALWSSVDDQTGKPLDRLYTTDDLSASTLVDMKAACRDFIAANTAALVAFHDATGTGAEQAGHDFWLTHNRHGAGFWDRGAGDIGDELSDAAHVYGESYLYVGDDGFIHAA